MPINPDTLAYNFTVDDTDEKLPSKLSSAQRKFLRGHAHHLDPVVQIGKAGLTDGVVEAVDRALDSHELIKVKFVEHKEDRKELARQLAESLAAEPVALIGNVSILFRQHEDEDRRQFVLPK